MTWLSLALPSASLRFGSFVSNGGWGPSQAHHEPTSHYWKGTVRASKHGDTCRRFQGWHLKEDSFCFLAEVLIWPRKWRGGEVLDQVSPPAPKIIPVPATEEPSVAPSYHSANGNWCKCNTRHLFQNASALCSSSLITVLHTPPEVPTGTWGFCMSSPPELSPVVLHNCRAEHMQKMNHYHCSLLCHCWQRDCFL